MKAHMSPTDRVMEQLKPQKIERLGDGKYRVDFGRGDFRMVKVNKC